jgi:2-keto-4-pentenoate hydratase/2-oxohepta-3-ene-1,7-dioic acid hydratase in catechol pathway
VKLCRFELNAEPDIIRSGMVFGGKIYETDGSSAIGVYEADQVRPLAPVMLAPSLRIFRNEFQPLSTPVADEPHFFYANPSALAGPSQTILFPSFTSRVSVLPFVAAIAVTPGYRVDVLDAEDMVLGLTLMCLVYAPEVQEEEQRAGGGPGRSIDLGGVLGPVITTPDELNDFVEDEEFGRRYKLDTVTRVNGVERDRGNLLDLQWTFAEAISHASQSCTIREGDIFAMGPVVEPEDPLVLEGGDEFQLTIEQLGTLKFRLAEDI